MKNIILFDVNQQHFDLLPLAFTRPVSDIRIGILTIREKWEHRLPGMYSYLTPEYMAAKYPAALSDDNIFIASHILPDDSLVYRAQNEMYMSGDRKKREKICRSKGCACQRH